jgi:hypothetical protein
MLVVVHAGSSGCHPVGRCGILELSFSREVLALEELRERHIFALLEIMIGIGRRFGPRVDGVGVGVVDEMVRLPVALLQLRVLGNERPFP